MFFRIQGKFFTGSNASLLFVKTLKGIFIDYKMSKKKSYHLQIKSLKCSSWFLVKKPKTTTTDPLPLY